MLRWMETVAWNLIVRQQLEPRQRILWNFKAFHLDLIIQPIVLFYTSDCHGVGWRVYMCVCMRERVQGAPNNPPVPEMQWFVFVSTRWRGVFSTCIWSPRPSLAQMTWHHRAQAKPLSSDPFQSIVCLDLTLRLVASTIQKAIFFSMQFTLFSQFFNYLPLFVRHATTKHSYGHPSALALLCPGLSSGPRKATN